MNGSRRLTLALLLLAGLGLAGCANLKEEVGTGFGLFGSKDTGPKPSPLPSFTPEAEASILWRAGVGDAAGFQFSPATQHGAVFAAGHDGRVSRLEPSSGATVWAVETGKRLSAGVGVGEGVVAVGTQKGEVIALDEQTGKVLWEARATSEVLSSPQVDSGLVIVRSGDSRIAAFDARDGKRKWVYQRSGPALSVRSYAGIVAERGAVFAGFPGGKLVAIDSASGGAAWEASVALPRGTTELERIADITSAPVVSPPGIFAVAYQGRVAGIDISGGNLVWARDMSSYAGLAVDNNALYVSDAKGTVIALDKMSGASLWKQDKLLYRQLSTPAVLGRHVVVGDLEGYIHVLAREDGAIIARLATDGSPIRVRPEPIDGGLLVQTAKGGLYAFTVR